MKRVLTTFAVAFIVFSMNAQNVITEKQSNASVMAKNELNLNGAKVTMDTLGLNDFLATSSIWSLGDADGGYVYGTTGGGGFSFAQGFYNVNSTSYGVTGAMVWISDLEILSASGSDITINLALLDDSSIYGSTPPNYDDFQIVCPGTVLTSVSFNINTIDTSGAGDNGIVFVDFPTTYYFNNQDGALVFDASACLAASDTIGVVAADENLAVFGESYIWWLYPDVTPFWTQASHVYTTAGTRSPALFPIVDNDFVNIEDNDFFQGIQLTVSPNPTPDVVNVAYATDNNNNVNIQIFDASGKLVYSQKEGNRAAGNYSAQFDMSKYGKGAFYCSVSTDNGRLTKKFIVE